LHEMYLVPMHIGIRLMIGLWPLILGISPYIA